MTVFGIVKHLDSSTSAVVFVLLLIFLFILEHVFEKLDELADGE
jgi:hypothetical protein